MEPTTNDEHAGAETTIAARSEQSARGDRRRTELVQAGIECLAREGWPGLTHRKVAEQAGAPAGLVRYHFGSLAGIRSAIARVASDHLILPVIEQLCATATIDDLVAAALALTTQSVEDPRSVRLLTQVVIGAAHYDDVAEIVGADMEAAQNRLAGHLVELDSGWTKAEAVEAAALFIGSLDGILLHGLVRPSTSTTSREHQLERLFRAILIAPGGV